MMKISMLKAKSMPTPISSRRRLYLSMKIRSCAAADRLADLTALGFLRMRGALFGDRPFFRMRLVRAAAGGGRPDEVLELGGGDAIPFCHPERTPGQFLVHHRADLLVAAVALGGIRLAQRRVERGGQHRHAHAGDVRAGRRDLLLIEADIDAARIRAVLQAGINHLKLRDVWRRVEHDAVIGRRVDGAGGDVDADLSQHRLDRGHDIGGKRRRVIGQKSYRLVAVDLIPARFLQQLPGLFRIVGIGLDARRHHLVGDIGAVCRFGGTAVKALNDRVAIDRVHHRLADSDILPDRRVVVEAEIVDDEGVAFDDAEILIVVEGLQIVGIDVGELDFAGAQCGNRRSRIGEIAVDDLFQRRFAAPVVGVGGKFDILIGDIFAELERPGADRRGRPPAVLGELVCGDLRKRVLRQHHHLRQRIHQAGRRRRQFDDQRLVVVGLGRGNGVQSRCENRAGLGVLGKLDGELRVLCGEGLAVMPFRVGKLERVGRLVGADLIGRGELADDLFELLVIGHQRFEVDAEPGEAARRGERVEIALEAAGPDIEAARERRCPRRGGVGRNGGRRHHRSKRDGG
ncbi:hypothetical protein RHECNPAF_2940039 [Rhizobium etli CNPAF512]|nr:hypothetical protein RHECNPAF_2940039 [Rhizobium etli CNPAF512]